LLAIPAGATVLAMGVWAGREPGLSAVAWAETASPHGATARYGAEIRSDGRGRGEVRLPMPPLTALSAESTGPVRVCEGDGPAVLRCSVLARTALLEPAHIRLKGTTVLPPLPAVTILDGRPVVENGTTENWRDGFLVWRGQAFALPPLAPGSRWDEAARAPAARGIPPAVATVSGNTVPVLVMPYLPREWDRLPSTLARSGWIAIEGALSAQESSP
jgi:hypothetical protein